MSDRIKEFLDEQVKKYETSDFIINDPVQFPHKFSDKLDQEISGLISSCLAYGKREKIIEDVEIIHKIMNYKPAEFVRNFDFKKDFKNFINFKHRYTAGNDVAILIHLIGIALQQYDSLEHIFLSGYSDTDKNIKPALTNFVSILKSYFPDDEKNLSGVNYLLPSPEKGSACKRLNLFLKWMIRTGPVDLNIWKKIPPSKLIIPLDTHVARLSRKLNLVCRNADDWKTAEEITENLKQFDSSDPVKYDFAIFGLGITGNANLLKDYLEL
ncbi:MAG: TIGR02757 family protein [Candidatus Gastranaerophilales bacterium]|nr:TIGR02757 family protein [Candidatus Gastranaerophilales bacterium]